MPEMPEVETTRRSLECLKGREIKLVRFSRLAPIETTTPLKIRRSFEKTRLKNPRRRGKYLLIENEVGRTLVIHLGMSGRLLFYENPVPSKNKNTHLEIIFQDESHLHFIDPRRFGTLSLSHTPDYLDNSFLARLGPDYDDLSLSEADFIKRCRRHAKISLKSLALHQGIASGLGNIYACESLYRAELDPRRLVSKTPDEKLAQFLKAARTALAQGISYGGVSMRDYLNGLGHRGTMKDFLLVYGREGQLSLDGRGLVKRIVQNARSTWFVPEVQK